MPQRRNPNPDKAMPPTGQRDRSGATLTRHALDRFIERFAADPLTAEASLRESLQRTRRLGTNHTNRAVAELALHRGTMLIAIFQDDSLLTVLTWPQFEPKLPEFGRPHLPRKRGRMLRRLRDGAEPRTAPASDFEITPGHPPDTGKE